MSDGYYCIGTRYLHAAQFLAVGDIFPDIGSWLQHRSQFFPAILI